MYNIFHDVYRPKKPIPDPSREYLDPEGREDRRQEKAKARRQQRKKSKFIDDSAIESDGEGGDIPSTQSSVDRSKVLKFVNCNLCGLQVSCDQQLDKHRGSKKGRKLQDKSKANRCYACHKGFVSSHDRHRHKPAKNH